MADVSERPEGVPEPDESELVDGELDGVTGGIETTEWWQEPAPDNAGKKGA